MFSVWFPFIYLVLFGLVPLKEAFTVREFLVLTRLKRQFDESKKCLQKTIHNDGK